MDERGAYIRLYEDRRHAECGCHHCSAGRLAYAWKGFERRRVARESSAVFADDRLGGAFQIESPPAVPKPFPYREKLRDRRLRKRFRIWELLEEFFIFF